MLVEVIDLYASVALYSEFEKKTVSHGFRIDFLHK